MNWCHYVTILIIRWIESSLYFRSGWNCIISGYFNFLTCLLTEDGSGMTWMCLFYQYIDIIRNSIRFWICFPWYILSCLASRFLRGVVAWKNIFRSGALRKGYCSFSFSFNRWKLYFSKKLEHGVLSSASLRKMAMIVSHHSY